MTDYRTGVQGVDFDHITHDAGDTEHLWSSADFAVRGYATGAGAQTAHRIDLEHGRSGARMTFDVETARRVRDLLSAAISHDDGVCPNPWHATSPARAAQHCPECPNRYSLPR